MNSFQIKIIANKHLSLVERDVNEFLHRMSAEGIKYVVCSVTPHYIAERNAYFVTVVYSIGIHQIETLKEEE